MSKSRRIQMLRFSWILLLIILSKSILAASDEKERRISKIYDVSKETVLRIENSFGEIQLITWDNQQFKIDIEIKVEGKNSDRAEKLLNAIEIDISENSGLISFRTDIEDKLNTKGDESFEINYRVMVPAENEIDIENQFGDTYIGKRLGDAEIRVKFGNLKTEDFEGFLDLDLSFGNGRIGNTIKSEVIVKYGELDMGNGQSIEIEQQFSELNMGDFETIILESKYGRADLGRVGSLDAEVQFSGFQVERINRRLDLEGSYISDFQLKSLSKDFESVRFYGKFSEMEIQLEVGLKAVIEADMSFCKLKDYADQIDFYYESKEDTRKEYKGKIGGGDDKKRITIKSSYGDVKIN